MLRDLSFWVAVSQLSLVLMGVWIALHEDWAKRHRFLVLAAFIVAGFVGLYITRQQSRQSLQDVADAQRQTAEANVKLSNTLEKINNQSAQIGNQTGEIARVQNLNTELQEKLLGQSDQLIGSSKTISDLSQQAIDTSTGGRSVCYMVVPNGAPSNITTPMFIHSGKYPIYDVSARVTRYDKLSKIASVTVPVGNMALNSTFIKSFNELAINESSQQVDFYIDFYGRNGYWWQELQLRKAPHGWSQALRVFYLNTPIGSRQPKKPMLQIIDTDFPTPIEWQFGPLGVRRSKRNPNDELDRFKRKPEKPN